MDIETLSAVDLGTIVRALDFMATESTLQDRVMLPVCMATGDNSAAPLHTLARKVARVHDRVVRDRVMEIVDAQRQRS